MKFIADLHIHSRFSRATARNLDPENIYMAARTKGLTVVGTGDFTHPAWLAELMDKLVPAEQGLFKLKDELESTCEAQLRIPVKRPVRFMLSAEISNIYKKDGATRKIHHLVFLQGFSDVKKFNTRLSEIGNLKSDGRPILGLDSKDLLDITLETGPGAFLVPAHIWTPWFSLYGYKSGFDSMRECFEDLSDHVFAVETGLSSDPPMNWRVPDLDGITLISNSDAHSLATLGREATIFNTELSYDAIYQAIKSGDPDRFLGTLEFFPEEGKYYQDGHRKCNVCFTPRQSRKENLKCPVCGQELTLGVQHRVEALAKREYGEKPERTHPFYSLIPLSEILSELLGVGPKSKKVCSAYEQAIQMMGPELDILLDASKEALSNTGVMMLDEAVLRMRQGRVHLQPGYDGEYGRVTVFTPQERDLLFNRGSIISPVLQKT
jgi:DNA helicase II / ATP-dependent DNA helicase PcrA